MKEFISKKESTKRSANNIYTKISDFSTFKDYLPEQIINWNSTADECSFTIKGMASVSMRFRNRIPNKKVVIESVDAPFLFDITIAITEPANSDEVFCQTTLFADLNPMLSMLASRPLQHLVDTINKKITG